MKPITYHHIGKHFYHRKAILEYYDSANFLLGSEEFKIIPENRFLYFGLNLDMFYVSYYEEYEIIIYEDIDIKEVDGKYLYVLESTKEPLPQSSIDIALINKLYGLPLDQTNDFLTYQIQKYSNRKDHLKRWKELIESRPDLGDSLSGRYRPEVQKRALDWLNRRIRKKNLREYKPKKDVPFELLFKTPETLQSLLKQLEYHTYIRYDHFTGRYVWLKGGQDLAILGEVLQKREYYKIWPDYVTRHFAFTSYFIPKEGKKYSERTFRRSTIEEVYNLKYGQFSFIQHLSK